MTNAFNRKLAEQKLRRAKMFLRFKERGMKEKDIALKYKISVQKVNELINHARKNLTKE